MVLQTMRYPQRILILSVLALSSRFDGHPTYAITITETTAFSTRSVESF